MKTRRTYQSILTVGILLTIGLVATQAQTASISGEVIYSGSQTGTIHITASAASTATAPTNGLVAYYPFNGNANDESGSGNTGVVHGPDLTTNGWSGSAYDFGSELDYIEAADSSSLDVTNALTLSAWINLDSLPGANNRGIVSKYSMEGERGYSLSYAANPNTFKFYISANGESAQSVEGKTVLETGRWYHLCGVFKPEHSMRIYVDGQLDGERTNDVPSHIFNNTTPLWIGVVSYLEDWLSFDGQIDEVRVYNRVLSSTEVAQLNGIHSVQTAVAGAYSITNLPIPADYVVTAFMDSNSNGVQDVTEASGSYSNNPVYVSNDVTGVDIELTDPDLPPSNTVASISGEVIYSGSQTGTIHITASATTTVTGSVEIAVAGAYSITNLPIPADYVVTAFMDSNSNGVQDVTEASGSYSNNPVYVSNDVTGVDIELTDPDLPPSNTVASISGEVTYSGSQTGIIHIVASAENTATAPTNGLVAYYPFNGNANDESGNGNTGIVHGAVLTIDRFSQTNNAYAFDGNDYINVGQLGLDTGVGLTLSGWCRLDDKSLRQAFIGALSRDPWNRHYAGLRNSSYWCGAGDTQVYSNSALAIKDNEWFHFVLTMDGSTAKYYINGQQIDSTSYTQQGVCDVNTYIGSVNEEGIGYLYPIVGVMDEVCIYDRPLLPVEIRQLCGIHCAEIATPGAYSITNLPVPANYVVGAFLDTNGNGVWDGWEPKGAYPFNPVYLTNDVTGVDILLSETISGDSDNDGISDDLELRQGTDPGNPDSFPPVRTDFDGDGNTDLGCYDAAGIPGVVPPGTWYFMISGDGFRVDQFGYAGTIPVVGDFDGDGVGDYGCYDPAGIPGVVDAGGWYFMKSTEGFDASVNFGYVGTVPVVGDFDGDGTDDYGCYDANGVFGFVDPGAWYFMTSSNGFLTDSFGYAGTVPVAGDFDGDGIDDYGCYDAVGIPGVVPPGQWYIMKSRDGFDASVRFGYEGTVPVVGDFDGDGIDDYGCYDAVGIPGVASPGSWYFLKSADGFDDSVSFGYKGTVPIVGDYDKDGIDDYGCFDAAGIPGFVDPGSWYLMKSTDGFDTETFGYDGTVPLGGMPVE